MGKKKKRASTLPRVTVLAFNRRELLAFVEAVTKLEGVVRDLQTAAAALPRSKTKKPTAVSRPDMTLSDPALLLPPIPSLGGQP